jgi:hypothetical protein
MGVMRALHETMLSELFEANRGFVTRRALLGRRFSPRQIDLLLGHGRLVPFLRGVYRQPGAELAMEQMLYAATLAPATGGYASHRAAAWLWGLPGGIEMIEITCFRWKRVQQIELVVHESCRLESADVGLVRGVPTTRPERTLCDLAGLAERGRFDVATLDLALAEATRRDLVSPESMQITMHRLRDDFRLGGETMRLALERWDPTSGLTESPGETELVLILRIAGFDVVPQLWVEACDGTRMRLDIYLPEVNIDVEYSPYSTHGARDRQVNDAERRMRLDQLGITMLEVTKEELAAGCPNLLRALAARRRRSPGDPLTQTTIDATD